jgi:hypothetical protein
VKNELTNKLGFDGKSDVRYLAFKTGIIEVTRATNDRFYDKDGCEYAFAEDANMVDKISRIGVWPFVFPQGTVLDAPAKVHDFMYSCPSYQAYHTREEADAYLRENELKATEGSWLRIFVQPFYWITRVLGGRYWENKETK